MRRWLAIVAALVASLLPLYAAAGDRDSVRWEEQMEQMVVTATRTPRLLKDVPVLTRVLTAEDIRLADANGVAELLQQELPGLEFSWAMSREVSLNMNGFGGNNILFLIDGERLAGETMNNIDYQRLSLDNIERIEIVRGAASSLYGSNATGGVINIITKKAKQKVSLNVNAHAGSHADYRFGGVLGNRIGQVSNVLSGRYTHMGMYEMSPFKSSVGERLIANKNHTWQVEDRLTWTPVSRLSLTARAGYFFRERVYDSSQNNRYRDFSGGLRGEYRFGADHTLELAYSFDQYDKSDFSTITRYDIRDYSNVQNSLRALYNNRIADCLTLTVGGDVMRDYMRSYMFEGGGRSQVTADALVQADWEIDSRWEVVGGARYDYYSESAASSLTGKLSARFKASKDVTLRASYSGGFRAPTLKEMFMDFDMSGVFKIYGNPHLKPERSHNFQASAEFSRGGWNLSATLSHNIVSNRITTIWDPTALGLYGNLGAMRYLNVADMAVTGAEANVAWTIDRHWDARLSYCFNYVHLPSSSLYTDDTRPHSLTARVGYRLTFGREVLSTKTGTLKSHILNINLSGRYLSPLNIYELDESYSRLNTFRTHYDGYLMLKLTAQLRTPWGFTFAASADNLLNYRPAVYTYYSPKTTGTTFTVGVSYDL